METLDFDVRHRFLASYIWDLPIGKISILHRT